MGAADGAEFVVEAGPVEQLLLVVEDVVLGVREEPLGGGGLGGEGAQHGRGERGRSVARVEAVHHVGRSQAASLDLRV